MLAVFMISDVQRYFCPIIDGKMSFETVRQLGTACDVSNR